MRIGIATLAAFAALLIAKPVAAQDEYISIVVCNHSHLTARVAVHGYNGFWTVKGWWHVSPGECKPVETVQRGYVDLYAESFDTKTKWGGYKGGTPANICVPTGDTPFVRDSYEGYRCGQWEVMRVAARFFVDPPEYTWTWHLNPET